MYTGGRPESKVTYRDSRAPFVDVRCRKLAETNFDVPTGSCSRRRRTSRIPRLDRAGVFYPTLSSPSSQDPVHSVRGTGTESATHRKQDRRGTAEKTFKKNLYLLHENTARQFPGALRSSGGDERPPDEISRARRPSPCRQAREALGGKHFPDDNAVEGGGPRVLRQRNYIALLRSL